MIKNVCFKFGGLVHRNSDQRSGRVIKNVRHKAESKTTGGLVIHTELHEDTQAGMLDTQWFIHKQAQR